MIQKIKDEIEKYLECLIITENNTNNRNFIKYDLTYLLDTYISRNDIFDYKIICDIENNTANQKYINVDVYVQEHKMYKKMCISFIYSIDELYALRKIRKNKLEKICTLSKM